MPNLRDVTIVTFTPVKNDAGLSGAVIGTIFGNYEPFHCTVDLAELHDGDVPIVDPPTWRQTGVQGWIEWSHCVVGSNTAEEIHILTIVYKDGRQPVSKIIP